MSFNVRWFFQSLIVLLMAVAMSYSWANGTAFSRTLPVASEALIEFFFGQDHTACEANLVRKSDVASKTSLALEIRLERVTLRQAHTDDYSFLQNLFRDSSIVSNYLLRELWADFDTKIYLNYHLIPAVQMGNSSRLGEVRRFRFIVESGSSRQRIGIGLIQRSESTGHWDIGYAIASDHRRHGYASEVIDGLLRFISQNSEHGVVTAFPLLTNGASRCLLKKLGFVELESDVGDYTIPKNHSCFNLRY